MTNISGRAAVHAFIRAGWRLEKQVGSHAILANDRRPTKLSVPLSPELSQGTLRALIRYSGLSVARFLDYL